MGCSPARPLLVFLCLHTYRNTLSFTDVHRFSSAHAKLSFSYYLQNFLFKASTCRPKVRKFYWFPSRRLPFWSFCLATQSIETTVLLIQPGGKRLQLISSTAPLESCCLPAKQAQCSWTGQRQEGCVAMWGGCPKLCCWFSLAPVHIVNRLWHSNCFHHSR